VGIGASAGGLQALQALFDHLPGDTGMAFVVVTHMHPEHESHLAELLQTHTSMQVKQVEKRISIKPNHVYVMPPNHQVQVTDQHLALGEFEEPRGRRTPIDHLFRSLAAAHRNAIGVILSGSGTDGSVGSKDIKENGGLLLVQSPEEAEYDGMPRAAITTGLADLIMPVAKLAAKLADYARQAPPLPEDPENLTEMQQDNIERILAQVHVRTGNDFAHYKRSTILRRIQRRMQLNGFTTLEAYLEFLRQHTTEASAMFNDILIGVTNFFRDRPSWEALAEAPLPALFENRPSNTAVRVWSIGCATGEEAYALAMLLIEQASRLDKHFTMQVFASDLAEASLAHAREGLYPAAIEADVSPERLERFFSQEGEHYRVKRELRDMVLFTNHNVLRDPPFSHIDLIVCRNLLIYLRRDVQDSIFETFHYALNPGGFLFLGNSESADSVPNLFNATDKAHRIYRVRPWKGAQPHIPALPMTESSMRWKEVPRLRAPSTSQSTREVTADLFSEHELALEASAPPSLLIDEQYNILHVSDTAGRFLLQQQGEPTRELLKLVRQELQADLRTALFRAFEGGQALFTRPIWVRFNGSAHRVIASVRPLPKSTMRAESQALVIFLEDQADRPIGSQEPQKPADSDANQMFMQVQAENHRLQEQLQSVVEEYNSSNEEMKAANEELQSINEEYRSTTEELETSREELQSVNEELQTVNNELKSKLEEISRANSDLENLMGASEVATLFLNREMQIKRFTAGMDQILNLLPSDHGRPVAHFANKLGYDELIEDADDVLRRLAPLERELHSKSGRWFLVRLRPYRTVEHKIDGVVITFVDITELKHAQQELAEINENLQTRVEERTGELDRANQRLSSVNQLFTTLFESNPIPTALNRLSDWEFINANQAYLDYFGIQREDLIGKSAINFGFAPNQDLRGQMREQLQKQGSIQHIELTHPFPSSGETRTALGSMQSVQMEGEPRVISSFIDITERVKAEGQVRALASELTIAEQNERHRISQVLHDELQQRLFAVRMQLTFLREALEEGALAKIKTDLPQIEAGVAEAIEVTRDLSIELSPMILRGDEIPAAITWLGTRMEEKFGLHVTVAGDEGDFHVNEGLRILLYQAIHELLFNVVKHANTQQAQVVMERVDGRLRISVSDHGKGFDTEILKRRAGSSSGLKNIQTKLTLLGCSMVVHSAPQSGTEILIETPIQHPKD
jgi:two-component system CheB/CheR fusion protein